jgi:hypothetical protein
MPYNRAWGSAHPGCLIILLDQSGSMGDTFGGSQIGAGKRKCDMVATLVNSFLHELVETNSVGPEVRPRADIAVIGYNGNGVRSALGGALASKTFVTLPELRNDPLRVETRTKKEMDDTGSVVEQTVFFPVWVEPVADSGTPMCAGLRHAQNLAAQWAASHKDNYPPVIVNVSDGASTDGDPTSVGRDIAQVRTSDGEALMFNCHITDLPTKEIAFVGSESDVPNDQYARQLFAMSSVIPETARTNILAMTQTELPGGARGFIFNGDAASVKQMFTFASIARTIPLNDPNR